MLRHMLVTFLIVAAVYTSLLFVIGHPLVATAASEQVTVSEPESEVDTDIDTGIATGVDTGIATGVDTSIATGVDTGIATGVDKSHKASRQISIETPKLVSQRELPLFHPSTIVGVSRVVALQDDGTSVSQLWQELLQNKKLVNRVDWRSNDIKAYAYYSEFNDTMSKARLAIGFEARSMKGQIGNGNPLVNEIYLPAGQYQHYQMQFDTGALPDKAWANALLNGNLVERHTLNRDGERISADAIVVLRKQK